MFESSPEVSSTQKRGEEHLEDLRAAAAPHCEQSAVIVHPSVAKDVSQMFPWKGVTACRAGSPGPLNMLRRSDLWSLRCPPGGAGRKKRGCSGRPAPLQPMRKSSSRRPPPRHRWRAAQSYSATLIWRTTKGTAGRPCDPQETLPPRVFTCAPDSVFAQ